MTKYLITFVDDDQEFLRSLEASLPGKVSALCEDFACSFEFVSSQEELMSVLGSAAQDGACPAMVVSDQMMPRISGIDLMEQLKADYPDMVYVLLTGHAGLESAKYAINRHLLDQYVCKPIEDLQEFASVLANLLKRHNLQLQDRRRAAELAATVEELRVSSGKIRSMQSAAEQVALLAKELKCLDFDEVLQLVTRRVPAMFQADWAVLCCPRGIAPYAGREAVARKECPACQQFLLSRKDAQEASQTCSVIKCSVPATCERLGGRSPSLIIPLAINTSSARGGGKEENLQAYICMCRMEQSDVASEEVLMYKGGLVRDVVSANLTNAALYSIARLQSEVDPLTGASTRRVLEAKMHGEYERACRYGQRFSLAVIDVDNFKAVNDAFGHDTGDRLLCELAQIMRLQVRSCDTLCRYGGDEFVWLMPETSAQEAAAAVERLRALVESTFIAGRTEATISCGVAQWLGSPADTAANVLRRADGAMYRAKREGRNRVRTAKEATAGTRR